jgi:hypothetical protein
MTDDVRKELEAQKNAAEAEVLRLRAEHKKLVEGAGRSEQRKASAAREAARERLEAATDALRVFDKTGSEHGLVAERDRVFGTVAVKLAPGITQDARVHAIDDALSEQLIAAAGELSVVLSAAPSRYTRERPGRDAEGRTVLEVAGRVEGDLLTPAVSRGAKLRRR